MKFIAKNYSKIPVITVANKSDLINLDDFQKEIINKNLKIDFFTSAKSGENVEEIFRNLTIEMTK